MVRKNSALASERVRHRYDRWVLSAVPIVVRVISDLIAWVGIGFRQRKSLQAEVLFLRRQLALYVERGVKPRRIDAATRVSLALLSRLFEWRSALVVVRPGTVVRWHRAGFRLFWRWRSCPDSVGVTAADPTDGEGEPAVGPGAHCE